MTRIAPKKLIPQNLARDARLDPKSLHLTRPAQPAGSKTISEQKQDHFFPGGAPGSGGLRDSTWVGGGKAPGKKPLLTGSNPVKGDSFGADRINRRHHGGEMTGSKNEQVSTTFRVDAENDSSTVVDPNAGKTRDDLAKENQQQALRIQALEDALKFERLMNGKNKAKTPNPMDDGASGGPVTQQEVTTNRKGIKGPRTDGDDGRGGTQQAAGGGPVRDTTGQDDRPERAKNTGTLNMDAVLKIDQLVNPQRH
jgi:hypothetical protein